MKNYFLPTKENNYTPKLLTHKFITIYTFLLLVFNIATSNTKIFAAIADVDSASILELHNVERQKNGLETLTLNSKLTSSAKSKAKAMMAADCWDHYCPNDKSPWDFIEDVGYDYVYAGENLAEGFSDNQKVFDAWMNSKTHRENILRADFDEIGIAIEYGEFQGIRNNALIVVHFGSATSGNIQNDIEKSGQTQNQFGTKILFPKDGAILNNNTPIIEGQAEDGKISIYSDNEYVSSATADEGIFTYRFVGENSFTDGVHTVKAEHTTNLSTDEIEITVDTILPEIESLNFDSVLKKDKQNFVVIDLYGSADINQITTNLEKVEIGKISDTNWVLKIDYEEFKSHTDIEISVFDEAGNANQKTVNLTSIKGIANNKILEFSDPESRLIFGIDKIGLRRSINMIFALFIMGLILIDYLALTRMSLEVDVAKKHVGHHFSIFATLLFIAFVGGTTGELLDGVNS